jgi:F0F1-type ATP synthase delta subunit
MTKAAAYAKALYAAKNPRMANVRAALQKRGHLKLLPHILSEYQKLVLKERRLAEQKKVTPAQERTRILLELYKKLVHA